MAKLSDRTTVNLILCIGFQGEQKQQLPLCEVVPNWADLNKDELGEALHDYWLEWVWKYIDGGAQIGS